MSEARFCDRCGRIFSVNEKGWSSGQMGTPVERQDGSTFTKSVQIDICGECNTSTFSGAAERAAISAGVKPETLDEVSRRVRTNERDTGTDPRYMGGSERFVD